MGIGLFIGKLFSNNDDGVTLTGEQAAIVQGLLQKEMREVDMKRYNIVDKAAKEGQMLPIESMRRGLEGASQEVLDAAEIQIQEMFDKYGAEMPANTAQRFVREIDGESIWSDNPGCFEQHLLRRDGNRLFPKARRVVTVEEILFAQASDAQLQQVFEAKSVQFIESLGSLKDNNTVDRTLELLKAAEGLAEEAAVLGGKAQQLVIQTIDGLETALRKMLNDAVPEGADQLAQAEALSIVMRIHYIAQTSSPLKPIPDDEATAALLSENPGIISMVSQMRSNMSPDFKPNDKDVKDALDAAVADGFSKRRAGKIWAAWSGYES